MSREIYLFFMESPPEKPVSFIYGRIHAPQAEGDHNKGAEQERRDKPVSHIYYYNKEASPNE